MIIGFDLISDLNLEPGDSFNWEGKATSLYCLIAGNISHDLRTIGLTLLHLSKYYQGIFYTLGSTEFKNSADITARTSEITVMCKRIPNVALLQQQVVIIDGVAIVGCNGWYGNTPPNLTESAEDKISGSRVGDIAYLTRAVERLQKHLDVTKILVLTNSVPSPELYFGEVPSTITDQVELSITLNADSESKISHWAYGTYNKQVDAEIDGINYVTNPYFNRNPYWAKRINVSV